MSSKDAGQHIVPTHILGTTGDTANADIGYRLLGDFRQDLGVIPSVLHFNAVGDNSTLNDSPFTVMENSSINSFYLPEGTYRLGTVNILYKRYWGPGKIRFADDFIQHGEIFSNKQPRNFSGSVEFTSPTDIVMNPDGNVQFAGKRVLNVGDPVGPKDAVNQRTLDSIIASLPISGWSSSLPFYDSGTFTPVVVGDVTDGVGTYSIQRGNWIRIGKLVHVEVFVRWSSHTGTTNTRIEWDEFAPLPTGAVRGHCLLGNNFDWGAANAQMTSVYIQPASTPRTFELVRYFDNGVANFIPLSSSGDITLSVDYITQ